MRRFIASRWTEKEAVGVKDLRRCGIARAVMFLPFPEGWHPRAHRVLPQTHVSAALSASPSLSRDGAHNPDICRFSGNKTRVSYRRSPPENRYCFRLIKKRAARYPNNAQTPMSSTFLSSFFVDRQSDDVTSTSRSRRAQESLKNFAT